MQGSGEGKDTVISIIIPTFNAAPHLRLCLDAIEAQPYPHLEIIVVDGGSTDDTIAILEQATIRNLTWVSEADKGIYDAMNKGTKLATGKWFYFLGADDRLLPGFSELAQQLKDENTIYYGNSKPDFGNRKDQFELLTGAFTKYRLAKYCMNHQSILYPAAIFKEYQYNLRYKMLADYDLNLKLWGSKKYRKVYIPVTIVLYNMSGASAYTNDSDFKKDKPMLVKQSMGWLIYLRYMYKRYKLKKKGIAYF